MSTSTLGGHVNTILEQAIGGRRRRRLHSDQFKANAVASCRRPGMSMAAVAMVVDDNYLGRRVASRRNVTRWLVVVLAPSFSFSMLPPGAKRPVPLYLRSFVRF